MANFALLWAALADGQPVTAAELRQLAEYVQKCANFDGGSTHELVGDVEISGSSAQVLLTDGAKLVADGDGVIKATGSSAWLIANLSSIVSLEVTDDASAKIEWVGSTSWPKLSSRSVPRQPRANWYPEIGTWTYGNGIWTATGNGDNLVLDEQIETNATLDEVYVYLDCPSHPNWPPQYPTHVALYKRSASAGTMALIAEKDDPLVPDYQSNYQAQHSISFDDLATTFTYGERLYVRLTTEHGTYAAGTGTTVSGARLSSYFTDLRQG